MKKMLLTFFLIFVLFTQTVYAQNDIENYEIDKNFEYSDEIVGHALRSTVGLIVFEQECDLNYKPISIRIDNWVNAVNSTKNVYEQKISNGELSKKDAEEEFYENAYHLLSNYVVYERSKTVKANYTHTGSCVVISDEGYIATNQHVVAAKEEDKIHMYITTNTDITNEYDSNIEDIFIAIQQAAGADFLTEQRKQELADFVVEYYVDGMRILKEYEPIITVLFPDADGNTNLNLANKYQAEIIKEGVNDFDEADTRDAAIIKINAIAIL